MTTSPCTRCGLPVMPDRQAAGFWVDQWNGRFCGGDQRFPHQAPAHGSPHHAAPGDGFPHNAAPGDGFPHNAAPGEGSPHHAPPPGNLAHHAAAGGFPRHGAPATGRKKTLTTLWVVVGCVAVVALLVVAGAVVFVLNRGEDGPAVAQVEQSSSAPDRPTAPPTTKKPDKPKVKDAPVPCEPARERSVHCFPPSMKGPAFLERIHKARKWRCYEEGEKDETGFERSRNECEAVNNVDQPFTERATIGYEHYKESSLIDRVIIVASTHAENQGTNAKNSADLGNRVFDIAVTHLWPGNARLRQEAKRAYAKLRRECNQPNSHPDNVQLPTGYAVSCGIPTPVSVENSKGVPVLTITQSMSIEVPFDYGWD
ncbi:hypothetical protein ITP53_51850 [Nonomuraea sp. K274]|uniref:Uncharacterized protein n=1 Tax=Nonomuraea cypriaca TaxID=1187855 RepID=A0A931F4U0_9ACTN|nr:hypothetical protein [Nonomuraea cypriaca]MBF8194030.1 hypothetical protein [Nonomuraea cypriaca]